MGVPRHLISIAEVVEDCRWWKLVHKKLPYRYNGTHHITQYSCTKPKCDYQNDDSRMGYCMLCGNVHKISKEERP